jgi:hypothetical protein
VLEGFEERGGARCARIRTVAAVRRPQPKGMTPPDVGIGEGAALARIRAEGTTWLGLDGCLREDVLDVRMRVENVATKAAMEWRLRRTVVAQPRSAGPLPKEWSRYMGGVPHVVGYEAALEEARFAGRALLCVVLRYGDPESEALALSLRDRDVREKHAAYLPAIVDADAMGSFPHGDLLMGMAGLVYVGLDGDTIFQIAGVAPPEILRTVVEVPQARAPEPRPTPEYVALEKERDVLRAALGEEDVRGALAAVRAIRAVGKGPAIQAEAGAADEALAEAGAERVLAARVLAAAKKSKEARAALEAVAADYEGHPVADRAREALAALPAPKPKPGS